MPPKPKYTKSDIISTAYEITRETGIDSVVARAVGKRLGTSSSPIFTVFHNMDELKEEVYKLAKQRYREYMLDIFEYAPAFKEFGMRWVRFASEEPNLYRLLFLSRKDGVSPFQQFQMNFDDLLVPLVNEIVVEFGLGQTDAEDLLNQMIIFANGISAFTITGSVAFSEEAVSSSLSKVCIGITIANQLIEGTFDMSIAKEMADSSIRGMQIRKKS